MLEKMLDKYHTFVEVANCSILQLITTYIYTYIDDNLLVPESHTTSTNRSSSIRYIDNLLQSYEVRNQAY